MFGPEDGIQRVDEATDKKTEEIDIEGFEPGSEGGKDYSVPTGSEFEGPDKSGGYEVPEKSKTESKDIASGYGFGPDMDQIINKAAESSDKWQRETNAVTEFMKRAFEIDEDKKELPHLFVEYLEKNNMRDILEQVGQVRTWDDLKNKMEMIQSKDPQMSLRIMSLFTKFKKPPR